MSQLDHRSTADPAATRKRVAIIGAGITGLAAAHRLVTRSTDVDVTVLEAGSHPGGIIRTEFRDGFLIERGPDSFITNKPGGIELCRELNLADQLISTDTRFRRSFVLARGRTVPVPDGFQLMQPNSVAAVLKSPILSVRGKLRFLAERFIPRRTDSADESLASFACRRFGREAFERLIQPLVGGIYTADPDRLSILATLPRFREMEAAYGSLTRAARAARAARHSGTAGTDHGSSGARYGLFATLPRGLGQLVNTLVDALQASGRASIAYRTPVTSVFRANDTSATPPLEAEGRKPSGNCSSCDPHSTRFNWMIELTNGELMPFDAVILTSPAHRAAAMLSDKTFDALRAELEAIEYASSAIVLSAHRLADFQHPLDASGLVIPSTERRQILAVSFASRKFAGRAPDGYILLRTFVGGAMQPEVLQAVDDGLQQIVTDELTSIFGMSRPPMFTEVVRYPSAMPQYHVGHLARVDRIEHLLKPHPGLGLAGSGYRGVGIPDSIATARHAADDILTALQIQPAAT